MQSEASFDRDSCEAASMKSPIGKVARTTEMFSDKDDRRGWQLHGVSESEQIGNKMPLGTSPWPVTAHTKKAPQVVLLEKSS